MARKLNSLSGFIHEEIRNFPAQGAPEDAVSSQDALFPEPRAHPCPELSDLPLIDIGKHSASTEPDPYDDDPFRI